MQENKIKTFSIIVKTSWTLNIEFIICCVQRSKYFNVLKVEKEYFGN
jgi:hypothetical protein